MKLAPLLAQYFYTNKRLDLPGIGTFMLDPSVIIEEEGSKNSKHNSTEGISFENNPSTKDVTQVIDFISSQTGKMKALAAADFDSYMELMHQFLNIGKPFLLEGIGSLVKIKSGQYAFTSGQIMSEKMKEYSAREISSTSSTEESFSEFKDKSSAGKGNRTWRKPVAFLLLMAGIALAIWGGYTMYKKTTQQDNLSPVTSEENKSEETVEVIDSLTKQNDTTSLAKDSITIVKDSIAPIAQSIPQGNYKFVVEVANKERGMQRFSTLKSWGLNIKMETTDSANFKIFFLLPAAASDTSRILDSLCALYTPYWRKGFVEN